MVEDLSVLSLTFSLLMSTSITNQSSYVESQYSAILASFKIQESSTLDHATLHLPFATSHHQSRSILYFPCV